MISDHTLCNWIVAAQNTMLLATIIWLPLRLPSRMHRPYFFFALYAAASLLAWTILCYAWLEWNYRMLYGTVPGAGPMFICFLAWSLGCAVYAIRIKIVRVRMRRLQNQASDATSEPAPGTDSSAHQDCRSA